MFMQVVKHYKSVDSMHGAKQTLASSHSGVYWRGLLEIDPGGEQKNHALWKRLHAILITNFPFSPMLKIWLVKHMKSTCPTENPLAPGL